MRRPLCFALALLLSAAPALAWSDYGHGTIARIATHEMAPGTQRRIHDLIARSDLLDTPSCPVRNLEEAAIWPDCIKSLGDRFSHAAPWHYQNISICAPFYPKAACPNGNCLSAQIERQLRLLSDAALPPRERLMALAFVAHLIGDLHMPLHVADRGDRGGGQLPVAYGIIAGPTHLHLAWDVYLEERSLSTPPAGAFGIIAELSTSDRMSMREGELEDWIRESWEFGRRFAYGPLLEAPCQAKTADRPVISETLTQRLIPLVRDRVARAGLRLARLLDESLAPAVH